MNIILFNISAPPEKVVKIKDDSAGVKVEDVIFKNNECLDIENPTIVLQMGNVIAKNVHFNYCKILQLGRYYYITKITANGGLVTYELEVDPLQSFHKDMLASEQYIIRSEKFQNPLIADPLLPLHSDHNLEVIPFGDDVYDGECSHVILETIGKGGTPS